MILILLAIRYATFQFFVIGSFCFLVKKTTKKWCALVKTNLDVHVSVLPFLFCVRFPLLGSKKTLIIVWESHDMIASSLICCSLSPISRKRRKKLRQEIIVLVNETLFPGFYFNFCCEKMMKLSSGWQKHWFKN